MTEKSMVEKEAEEKLAIVLFEKMEHLDPTDDGDLGWHGLTDHQRDFYITLIQRLLCEGGLLRTAMGISHSDEALKG